MREQLQYNSNIFTQQFNVNLLGVNEGDVLQLTPLETSFFFVEGYKQRAPQESGIERAVCF